MVADDDNNNYGGNHSVTVFFGNLPDDLMVRGGGGRGGAGAMPAATGGGGPRGAANANANANANATTMTMFGRRTLHDMDSDDGGGGDSTGGAPSPSLAAFSVDTTVLASSVGSVLLPAKDAFMRSVTFRRDEPKDLVWELALVDEGSIMLDPDNMPASASECIAEDDDDEDDDEDQARGGGGDSGLSPMDEGGDHVAPLSSSIGRTFVGRRALPMSSSSSVASSGLLGTSGRNFLLRLGGAGSSSGVDSGANNGSTGRSSKKRGGSRFSKRNKANRRVIVESIAGHASLSHIQPGDVVTRINRTKIGPSYNAARCTQLMKDVLNRQGILSVQVGNDDGMDTVVQVTVIKPRPEMTLEELGLVVWLWPGLCVHRVDRSSIFSYTSLKENDVLESVNNIAVSEISPKDFAKIIRALPCEITLIVRRGKERWNGNWL